MVTVNASNEKTAASGKVLQGQGVGTASDFSTATYPATAGTSGKVLISDGTNIVSSTPTFPNASASSGKFIRSDGTNWIASTPTLPTSAGTSGKILQSDATNYVESTATYPATTGANTFLTSTTANTIATATYIPATSYTPVLAFGGGSTGITYSTQFGNYQQIGNVVTVKINLVLTSKGSSTGTATITLPVTSASDSTTVEMAIGMVSTTLPAGTNYFAVDLASASTTILLIAIGSNAVAALADTNFANNSQARMCFSYFV